MKIGGEAKRDFRVLDLVWNEYLTRGRRERPAVPGVGRIPAATTVEFAKSDPRESSVGVSSGTQPPARAPLLQLCLLRTATARPPGVDPVGHRAPPRSEPAQRLRRI